MSIQKKSTKAEYGHFPWLWNPTPRDGEQAKEMGHFICWPF